MTKTIRDRIRIFGFCLFGIYITCLIYALFFAESYGRGAADRVYDYNLQPFHEIRRYLIWWRVLGIRRVVLNLVGNIIGFIPFGALLPILSRSVRKAWKVMALGLEISALVEVSQLILCVGCCDVDDMILNTCGAFLGYVLYVSAARSFRRFEQRVASEKGFCRKEKEWRNDRRIHL